MLRVLHKFFAVLQYDKNKSGPDFLHKKLFCINARLQQTFALKNPNKNARKLRISHPQDYLIKQNYTVSIGYFLIPS